MKAGDKVKVKAHGYMHKGMTGKVSKTNERFVYVIFPDNTNIWPYKAEELEVIE